MKYTMDDLIAIFGKHKIEFEADQKKLKEHWENEFTDKYPYDDKFHIIDAFLSLIHEIQDLKAQIENEDPAR